jgi:hypothetical protein
MTIPTHPSQCDEAALMFQVAVSMPGKHKTLLFHRICIRRYSVNSKNIHIANGIPVLTFIIPA